MQVTFKHGLKWTLTDVNESSSIRIMRNRPKYNSVYGHFKKVSMVEFSRCSSVSVSSGCDEHTYREMHKHNQIAVCRAARRHNRGHLFRASCKPMYELHAGRNLIALWGSFYIIKLPLSYVNSIHRMASNVHHTLTHMCPWIMEM